MYKFTVTLNAAYAGETVWNCQTLAHAEKLAEEFRAKGFTAIVA
jgi:FtsP/CotA-like multicopper oxidase with cupredoxin domain